MGSPKRSSVRNYLSTSKNHANMQNLQDALREAVTALHESLVNIASNHAMLYLTTEAVLCLDGIPACDRIQLGTLMRFMFSVGIPTLWTGQHHMVAPGAPPSVSAIEFITTFDKEDNLSDTPNSRPYSFSRKSWTDTLKEPRHTYCGIVKKIHRDIAVKLEEVRGLTGLM